MKIQQDFKMIRISTLFLLFIAFIIACNHVDAATTKKPTTTTKTTKSTTTTPKPATTKTTKSTTTTQKPATTKTTTTTKKPTTTKKITITTTTTTPTTTTEDPNSNIQLPCKPVHHQQYFPLLLPIFNFFYYYLRMITSVG